MNALINAILSRFSLDTIIQFLLAILIKALPGTWDKVKELVGKAEEQFPTTGSGANKKLWVQTQLTEWLVKKFGMDPNSIKTHWLDVMIGLAVAEMQKRLGKLTGLQDISGQ